LALYALYLTLITDGRKHSTTKRGSQGLFAIQTFGIIRPTTQRCVLEDYKL